MKLVGTLAIPFLLLIAAAIMFFPTSEKADAQIVSAAPATEMLQRGPSSGRVTAEIIAAPSVTQTVQVGPTDSIAFVPATLTINQGDTINWIWSSTIYSHSTTSGSNGIGDGKWDSGIFLAPHSFSFTFNNFGVFSYFCRVHFSIYGMSGTIIVRGPFNLFLPLIRK